MDAKVVIDAAKLALDVGKVAWSLTQPPGALREKWRWLQITIHNKTQFNLRWTGEEFFNAGRFWQSPTDIAKVSSGSFAVCNKDSTVATGVAGGAMFEVKAPGKGTRKFGIGFTNPAFGGVRARVTLDRSAEHAYDEATTDSSQVEYEFDGEDPQGRKGKVRLRFVMTAATEAALTVTQTFTLLEANKP